MQHVSSHFGKYHRMLAEWKERKEAEELDKCYLEYVDGYLTCTHNHKIDAPCLMKIGEDELRAEYESEPVQLTLPLR